MARWEQIEGQFTSDLDENIGDLLNKFADDTNIANRFVLIKWHTDQVESWGE